jgi:branched-chain amino acid transport system substrate-binding protein
VTSNWSGPTRRGRIRSVIAFATVFALLAACSDDNGSSDDSTTVPGTSSTTAAPAPEPTAADTMPEVAPAFVVGFAAPEAGLLTRLAVGQQRGLQLAIDDINEAGGVLGGPIAQVQSVAVSGAPLDDQLSDLVAQGANAILGPVGSPGADEFIAGLKSQSRVACSASATTPEVTADGDASVFFRTALRDDHMASEVADQVMDPTTGPPPASVMIIGRDDVFGNQLTVDLNAELTARGATVQVEAYPPRRVTFTPEAEAVAAAAPDRVIMVSYGEAPRLLADVVAGGYPADQIVGLEGFFVPTIASQAFPSDPTQADGLTIIATTGDRAFIDRLAAAPASDPQLSYAAQMYDCVVTLALAAAQAGSATAADIGAQVRSVTDGGRKCSSYGDCATLIASGEDIDYDGTTGGIAIDDHGDITTARVATGTITNGELVEVSAHDIDLAAVDLDALRASAVFTAQVQQLLRILGYLDTDATGVWDDATIEALKALQRDLGVPETGEFDEATEAALRDRAGSISDGLTASVKGIQQALADAGFYDGPIDGIYSDATREAVRALQRDLGVAETGIIDGATLRAIYERGAAVGIDEPDETEPPATEPPATTKPPVTEPPATQPPATEPPATEPPATEPPATEPPATEPPATEPPTTEPETVPPTTEPETVPPTTEPPPPADTGMMAVLAADPQFSTLVELLRAAGYEGDLGQPGRLTFFAPTNAAFAALPGIDTLTSDPDRLSAVLAYHLLEGSFTLAELPVGDVVTVNGAKVDIEREGSTVTVGGANVVQGDITASNGVIHAIDRVLTPPG